MISVQVAGVVGWLLFGVYAVTAALSVVQIVLNRKLERKRIQAFEAAKAVADRVEKLAKAGQN